MSVAILLGARLAAVGEPAAATGGRRWRRRERLLGFVAWLGGLLLVTGLLFRVLGRDRRRTAASPPIRNLRRRETRRRRGPVGGYADRAFPLIPQGGTAPAADARPPCKQPSRPPVDEQIAAGAGLAGERRR